MRALLLVLDSLAVGPLPNGPGAPDTLGGLLRHTPDLELPTLFSLGLDEILKGRVFDPPVQHCAASYGRMIQRAAGADFLSGLWEFAGVILGCPFLAANELPNEFTAALTRETGIEFLPNPSGNARLLTTPGSLDAIRKEHLRTGAPILTFSAHSHLHLAAHESTLPPSRLTHLCRIARQLCDTWRVARVTGQLLAGQPAWKAACPAFSFSMVPPRTLLNAISDRGLPVVAIGDINEAFARSGITRAYPAQSACECMQTIERLWISPQNGLIFAHLDLLADGKPDAFARNLAQFDAWLAGFLGQIENDDLLIVTGSNTSIPAALKPGHPRQEIPVLVRYDGRNAPLGLRESLADVAATLGSFFGIDERSRIGTAGEPLITFHHPRGFSGP
ncbi:MAG: hypothetical protein NTZ46_03365 [Verrucomicrobia bacterium]|nr:hypothetical protein [Verrucomicrobiota bacterium]